MAITKLQPFNLDTTANYTFANITATNANLGNAASANYFIGSGANLTSLPAGNISGQVANSAVAGTVYTNAQPNITSVGTLTGLTSNGVVDFTNTSNTTLGAVGNIHITGGTNAYVLSTDGTGNLSWVAQSGGGGSSISNGNSNVSIATANGNITMSAVGNAIMAITGTGVNVAGYTNITGNVALSGPNISLGSVSNLHITGGTNTYVLSTDGAGNLSWVAQSGGGGASISNGTSNVNIATSGGNVTVGVAGNANILTVTGTGANISGTLNVTGNTTVANLSTTGGDISNVNTITANTFVATLGANLGAVGNVIITGGTSGQVLSTDGAGNLSWATGGGGGGGATTGQAMLMALIFR